MSRDDIIRMAREAGGGTTWWPLHTDTLERFAALVADAEAAKWIKGAKISVPTATMEQQFSVYHRRGYEAGAAAERERVTYELVNEAQRAVQEAVWAEREACARVCDDWPNGRDDIYSIGVAIRARSEK